MNERNLFGRYFEEWQQRQIERQIRIPPDVEGNVSHWEIPLSEMITILGEIPEKSGRKLANNPSQVLDLLKVSKENATDLENYFQLNVAVREFSYFAEVLTQLDAPLSEWHSAILREVRTKRDWRKEASLAKGLLVELKKRSLYPGNEIRAVAIPIDRKIVGHNQYRIVVRREQSMFEQLLGAEDEVIYHIPSSACSGYIDIPGKISYWYGTDNPSYLLEKIKLAGNLNRFVRGKVIYESLEGSQPEWAVAAALGLMSSERDRFPIPQRILDTL